MMWAFFVLHLFFYRRFGKTHLRKMSAAATIISSDEVTFTVPLQIANKSTTITDILTEVGTDTPVPLPTITSATFTLVLKYLQYIHENPLDPKEFFTNILKPWEEQFFAGIDFQSVFALTLAANHLGIRSLLHLCAKFLAKHTKGKNLDQIREFYGITDPFTPEELAEMEEEDKWAIEK